MGGVTSSSVYNGDGLRMSHTVSAQTTSYTCDPSTGSGQAVVIGNTVIAPGACRPGSRCFTHESVHVGQYRELGFIGFLEKYFGEEPAKNAFKCVPAGLDFFGCLYRNNALEREAYDA